MYLKEFYFYCDATRPLPIYFQDTATSQMEGLIELHDKVMYYLFIILFAVFWVLISVLWNYISKINNKYVNLGTLIDIIWTISPAIILMLVAFPSFKLLYLMDEATDPQLALLEVDNRVIIPEDTHIGFIVSSGDDIDSYACLSLGLECDAYPGEFAMSGQLPGNPHWTTTATSNSKAMDIANLLNNADLRWTSFDQATNYLDKNGNEAVLTREGWLVWEYHDTSGAIVKDLCIHRNRATFSIGGRSYTGILYESGARIIDADTRAFGVKFNKLQSLRQTHNITTMGTPFNMDNRGDGLFKRHT